MQPAQPPTILRALVDERAQGERLDVALTKLFPSLSRRDAQRLCGEGRVRIGRKVRKKSELTRLGDEVTVELDHRRFAVPSPGPLELRLVTEHWVVVSKPALQPTAPKHSAETHALANALVAAFPEMAEIGHHATEPGLLHRLDNGTSGLLVAARSVAAFERATLALKRSRWQKSYVALLRSTELPETGCIEGALEAWPEEPRRVRAVTKVSLVPGTATRLSAEELGPYVTTYETLEQRGALRKVRVCVGPAFRHQIRAHFAAIGAPLLNDEIYGAPRETGLDVGRHALHAARVAWEGEADLPGFDVTEPLAVDLMTLFNNEGL